MTAAPLWLSMGAVSSCQAGVVSLCARPPARPTRRRWFSCTGWGPLPPSTGMPACQPSPAVSKSSPPIIAAMATAYAAAPSSGSRTAPTTWPRSSAKRPSPQRSCATARDFRGAPLEWAQFGVLGLAALVARRAPAIAPPLPHSERAHRPGIVLSELGGHERGALLAAAASLGSFTSRDWIGDLTTPAVVIVTKRDRIVPVRRQQKLAEALGAPVIELDAGHFAARIDPLVLARAISDAAVRLLSGHQNQVRDNNRTSWSTETRTGTAAGRVGTPSGVKPGATAANVLDVRPGECLS